MPFAESSGYYMVGDKEILFASDNLKSINKKATELSEEYDPQVQIYLLNRAGEPFLFGIVKSNPTREHFQTEVLPTQTIKLKEQNFEANSLAIKSRANLTAKYPDVPSTTIGALCRYVYLHEPGGHFVTAILNNNLLEAFKRADLENQRAMTQIVEILFNYLPAICWGDKEHVEKWLGLSNKDEQIRHLICNIGE